MRVLVTGGAGFIGSAVCRHLVTDGGASVLNIDKLTYAANLNSLRSLDNAPNYHFIQADICNYGAVTAAFENFQPDAVIHLAAESHVDRSITGAGVFVQTNVVGTYTLLEAARRYWSGLPDTRRDDFRFLHVSTDEVYGSLGRDGLFREDAPYDPSSPYSASKAASDHLLIAWHRTYGFPGIISNCSNNYGPYQFPEKLIPLMITNAIDDRPLPVYGDGHNVRDWLYVDDHVRALVLILSRGRVGQTYNVGARSEKTNLEIVEQICQLMDQHKPRGQPHKLLISFVADRPGHDRRYAIDPTKLEAELGWRAQETFASGLVKTVEWYLDNESWWRALQQRGYTGERLGLLIKPPDHETDRIE